MNVAIPGYEGLYEINHLGEVWSLDRYVQRQGKPLFRAGHKLRTHTNKDGYVLASLSKDGVSKGHSVHRLVAMAYLGVSEQQMTVNHKNGIKADNSVENLEWCTFTENVRHSYRELGRKNLAGELRKGTRPVKQYSLDGVLIKTHGTLHQASRDTGILVTAIANCIVGKSKTAGGFKWQPMSLR